MDLPGCKLHCLYTGQAMQWTANKYVLFYHTLLYNICAFCEQILHLQSQNIIYSVYLNTFFAYVILYTLSRVFQNNFILIPAWRSHSLCTILYQCFYLTWILTIHMRTVAYGVHFRHSFVKMEKEQGRETSYRNDSRFFFQQPARMMYF